MHEEALLRDLRGKIGEVAREHPGARIVRVRVGLGVLSHLDEGGLRSVWAHAMEGGPAAEATLEVELYAGIDHPHAAAVVLQSLTFDDAPARPKRAGRSSLATGRGGT